MRKLYQPIVPATIVLLALVMSAFWIMPVHADDGTPPSTAPAVTQPQGGSNDRPHPLLPAAGMRRL